jgi:hypothetical protein
LTGEQPTPSGVRGGQHLQASPAELRAFAGEYASAELDVTYSVVVRGTGLVIRTPGRADVPIRPVLPDTFNAPGLVDIVRFSRNRDGAVTGFTLHSEGVWGLRLQRSSTWTQ